MTSGAPKLLLPSGPQELTQQKGQQEDTAERAHVSVLRTSTSCFLDSGSPVEASWGAASQRWIPLLYPFLSLHAHSRPGTEGTRLEKCRGRTPGEELGPEAPPAVSGEQGVCLSGRGGVLWGGGRGLPAQAR